MNNELGAVAQGLDDVEDTYEAAKFATVTQVARTLVPIMTQEFPIRIKSSSKVHELLMFSVIYYGISERKELSKVASRLLGKTLMVKVDWSMLETGMWVTGTFEGHKLEMYLNEGYFKNVITQKKQPLAMFELWKTASRN
ncbi:hypothetical protein [Marinomonas phage CPP1m]|uniref:Uncharacterized protein n=2 Tax=Murciavirus CPP1m TaxID=2733327 RepID=A0A1W5S0Y9_9CAUD|nr:hypothetical protein HOR72_gp17 [Marinomonas phage CPP1m]ARB11236.1 hypothetical protein [Marinomonas phage CPP1m]ARB11286.1 hypothetical protein [Marinomonas phage CPG1g]